MPESVAHRERDAHRPGEGDAVVLAAELGGSERGRVHEIGSRARVLSSNGGLLTIAVGDGSGHVDVVTCLPGQVVPVTDRPRSRCAGPWRPPRPPAAASRPSAAS